MLWNEGHMASVTGGQYPLRALPPHLTPPQGSLLDNLVTLEKKNILKFHWGKDTHKLCTMKEGIRKGEKRKNQKLTDRGFSLDACVTGN